MLVSCGDPETPDAGSEGGNTDSGTTGTGDSGTPETPSYTISWFSADGTKLADTSVKEGSVPSYAYEPSDTAEWDYTLTGWAASAGGDALASIPAASADASYYAIVSSVKRSYTVSFNSLGGSEVDSQTVVYGEKATLPDAPTYEGYKFIGWCTDSACTTAANFESPITGNTEHFASWNKVVNAKALLNALLNGYELDPLSFIPSTMIPSTDAILVNPSEIVTDYSSAVNIDSITYGYGEQWKMVLDNLLQSETFFSALGAVEAISASSITIFNNYFDQNPADTAHHEFENGGYNVTVSLDDENIFFILDYTATFPIIGEQTAQIALCMDIESGERVTRIQLGDANALTYIATENSYEFAIKYAGVRRAYFSVQRDANGNVTGKIYEFLTAADKQLTSSTAEFYITEDYISVVGNKADAYIGATGYITELYDTASGSMIGYEIREVSEVPVIGTVTFNTLWFNLSDIDGISSIRYVEPTETEKSGSFFVNGSSKAWEYKTVGGINAKTASRRFDIEFRYQYVYSYDASTETYTVHTIKVPMLFIQEEYYEDAVKDIKSTNGITVSVSVLEADLAQLMVDYDTLIPVFIEHKNKVSADDIIAYIGNKIEF